LDLIYFITKNARFAQSSFDCMAFGLGSALLAIPTGLAEYQDIPLNTLPRRTATLHFSLNLFIFLLYGINLISRGIVPTGSPDPVISPTQLILSIISIILLGVSGYLGGKLVYSYGIGYQNHARESKSANQRRVA
jgi:uncharacterized membrane protein